MATANGFSALRYAENLKKAGVEEEQAAVHAEALQEALQPGFATGADGVRLETLIERGVNDVLLAIPVATGMMIGAAQVLP